MRFTRSQHWEIVEVPTYTENEINEELENLFPIYLRLENQDDPELIHIASKIQRLELEILIRKLGLRSMKTEDIQLLQNKTTDSMFSSAIHYELELRWVLNN